MTNREEALALAVDQLVLAVDRKLELVVDEACSAAGIGLEGDAWMDFRDEVLSKTATKLANFDL